MNNWRGIIVLFALAIAAVACKKSNNNSPFPQISLNSFAPDSLKAGSSKDTAFLFMSFEDGNSDLGVGSASSPNTSYIVVIDSRQKDSLIFDFPTIDPSLADPSRSMKGDFVVKVQAASLMIRTDSVHFQKGDTLKFTTYVVDNAGDQSNRVTTPDLILRP